MTISSKDLIEAHSVLLDIMNLNVMNATPNYIRDLQHRASLAEWKIKSAIPNVAVEVTEDK